MVDELFQPTLWLCPWEAEVKVKGMLANATVNSAIKSNHFEINMQNTKKADSVYIIFRLHSGNQLIIHVA